MQYRLIATDIDGTLLNEHHEPSPRARAVLEELRARGVIVVLNTGRAPRGIRSLYEGLGLTEPVVAFNGALTYHPRRTEPLQYRPIPNAVALGVLAAIRSVDPELNVGVEFVDEWHVDCIDDRLKARIAAGLVPVLPVTGDLEQAIATGSQGVSKMYIIAPLPVRAAVEATFTASGLDGEVAVTSSGPNIIEILAAGVNKGTALETLAAALGVPLAETVALGDEENDIPALRLAGLGVAMGNSSPQVKGSARVVTESNTADGWARAIEKYVLAG